MARERHISEIQAVLPSDPAAALLYVQNILRDLHLRLTELELGFQTVAYEEPSKRRDGMFRYADGVDWDPGEGIGLYFREAGQWVKVGTKGGKGTVMPVVEVPAGVINGVNDTFVVSASPTYLGLYWNGVRLLEGTGYTLSGATITMQTGYIPETGDILEAELWTTSPYTPTIEVPSGTIDGVNDEFTLSFSPTTLDLYWNGNKLREGIGYTLQGATIKMLAGYIPSTGDQLEAAIWLVSALEPTAEVPSGLINGVNDTFTLTATPTRLRLFWNGQKLIAGTGYTLAGSTITMLTGYIPNTGDTLEAELW